MKYIVSLLLLFPIILIPKTPTAPQTRRLITIMLDPAGDAKQTGRIIEDTTERGLTLSFAQELKKALERKYKNIRVVLTRFPGETLEPLQNALFAGALGTDFYCSILFFWQREGSSPVYIYHQLYHPVTDFWHTVPEEPVFYSYQKAYLFNLHSSHRYGTYLFDHLSKQAQEYQFETRGFIGIPFSPLKGIIAPSLAIEIGLKGKDDWRRFIDPLSSSFEPIIAALKEKTNL